MELTNRQNKGKTSTHTRAHTRTHEINLHKGPYICMSRYTCLYIIKDSRCFLEQETLPSLLSTGWFQERIRVWFT